jgi:hypothetical protein
MMAIVRSGKSAQVADTLGSVLGGADRVITLVSRHGPFGRPTLLNPNAPAWNETQCGCFDRSWKRLDVT